MPASASEVPTSVSAGYEPYAVEVASLYPGLRGRDCRFLDDNRTLVSRSGQVGAIDLSLFQQAAEGGTEGVAEADGAQFQRSFRLDHIPDEERQRVAGEMINKTPSLKTSWTEYFQDAVGRPFAFSLHGEGDVTIWDLESGMVRSVQTGDSTRRLSTAHEFNYDRNPNISVSPDGRAVLAGDLYRGFDLRLAMPTKTTDSTTLGIAVGADAIAVRFSGRGRWLAAAYESSIFVWKDPATRKDESSAPDLTIPIPPLASRYGMEFSQDERLLITGHLGGTVRVWDLERTGESKEIRYGAGDLVALAPSPDARFLATSVRAETDSRLTIWSLEDGRHVAVLLHDAAPESLAYSPDGRWLASNHSLLKLWMVNEPSVFTPVAPSTSPKPRDDKATAVDDGAQRLEASEQSARKALEDATATDNDRLRTGKLKRVLRSFPGTKAAVEAEQILREGSGNK